MSRKDFQLIAAAMRATKPTSDNEARDKLARLAGDLRATNARFNAARFLEACGS